MRRDSHWVTAGALALFVAVSAAAQPVQNQNRVQSETQMQQRIYGSQLMTPQERNEYRARMGNARSQQEREQIRAEHHWRMQQRAQARGLTLPDAPRGPGMGGMGPGMGGMGPGMGGMGPGMGPGVGGMGPGPGMGPGSGMGGMGAGAGGGGR